MKVKLKNMIFILRVAHSLVRCGWTSFWFFWNDLLPLLLFSSCLPAPRSLRGCVAAAAEDARWAVISRRMRKRGRAGKGRDATGREERKRSGPDLCRCLILCCDAPLALPLPVSHALGSPRSRSRRQFAPSSVRMRLPRYIIYRYIIIVIRTNSHAQIDRSPSVAFSVVFVILASASERYIICLFHPHPSAAPRRLWRNLNLIWLECEYLSECRSPACSRRRIGSDRIGSVCVASGVGSEWYPPTPPRLGDVSAKIFRWRKCVDEWSTTSIGHILLRWRFLGSELWTTRRNECFASMPENLVVVFHISDLLSI